MDRGRARITSRSGTAAAAVSTHNEVKLRCNGEGREGRQERTLEDCAQSVLGAPLKCKCSQAITLFPVQCSAVLRGLLVVRSVSTCPAQKGNIDSIQTNHCSPPLPPLLLPASWQVSATKKMFSDESGQKSALVYPMTDWLAGRLADGDQMSHKHRVSIINTSVSSSSE